MGFSKESMIIAIKMIAYLRVNINIVLTINMLPIISGRPKTTCIKRTDNNTEENGSIEASEPTSVGYRYLVLSI